MTKGQLRALFLVMLIAGSGLVLLGAFAKIQHWPSANFVIGAAMLLEIAAAIGLVIVSIRSRKGE